MTSRLHRWLFAALLVGANFACAQGPALRGKMKGLSTTVEDAEKNGAMRCAPRELAIAKSQLEFAEIDLSQGEMSAAQDHLAKAEPNAQAAFQNSPPDRCTSREFVEVVAGDRDGDGIPDTSDKCPDNPENYNGYEDQDGCPDDPDTDGDGIADSRDQCLVEPEDKDGYLDDDGCPDVDNDADGITDDKDQCKNDPEDMDGWKDDDGCPDPDNDADTVADLDDFCPNTPGVKGGDKPGCPKKNSLVVVTQTEIRITQQIQFEFNKAVIRPGISFKILDEVVQVLNDNPKISLEVQGHTDNVGGDAYNMNLSQKRADSVRAYMVSKGISAGRLVSKGYGFHQPLVPNTTAANRELNRRVQFIRTEAGAGP
jgi:outer membrane protein OmpA-like peptidoglycan-associated protein